MSSAYGVQIVLWLVSAGFVHIKEGYISAKTIYLAHWTPQQFKYQEGIYATGSGVIDDQFQLVIPLLDRTGAIPEVEKAARGILISSGFGDWHREFVYMQFLVSMAMGGHACSYYSKRHWTGIFIVILWRYYYWPKGKESLNLGWIG